MHLQSFGALEEKAVCELEARLGVTLPGSYRDFLKKTGGGVVAQDDSSRVPIPSIGKTISVDVFFGCGVTKNSDILCWTEMYGDEVPGNMILIGMADEHGFLCLSAEEGRPEVCYWDDSCFFEETDDDHSVYLLGQDFSMFDFR